LGTIPVRLIRCVSQSSTPLLAPSRAPAGWEGDPAMFEVTPRAPLTRRGTGIRSGPVRRDADIRFSLSRGPGNLPVPRGCRTGPTVKIKTSRIWVVLHDVGKKTRGFCNERGLLLAFSLPSGPS